MEGHGCRWTATPTADESEGRWDEQGINEYNVAMSATETEATNARCLGHDPLVENGVDEDSMVYLVLPFVKTAREGVKRLGKLIEKYGTGESNGVAFSDHNEVWYFETGAGHQWVAQRIPEDSYAICPNIMVIQDIDFDDHDNFMYASTIREFVEKNHLNQVLMVSGVLEIFLVLKLRLIAITTLQELGMVKSCLIQVLNKIP